MLRTTWARLGALGLAAFAAYSRTFAVPFYLDDYNSIRTNPLIYHWEGLAELWRYAPNRVFGNLTFAWNYQLGHFQVAGYHAVNLLVHVLAGVAVYALARGLLRTPRLRAGVPELARDALPLVAALLFVLHPLHTGAVTYIVQRLASLVALLYVTALASYVQARLASPGAVRGGWAIACAVATLLAFFTKENSATLPLAILLVELAFFAPSGRRMLATLTGAGVALGVFGLSVVIGHATDTLPTSAIATAFDATALSDRVRYFATELLALAHYQRLFVWPVGLRLDYDWWLVATGMQPGVLLAGLLHLTLLSAAALGWKTRPMLAFGVLFYYLAHAVESSVFPLVDLVFEHRAYLPDVGACLVVAWLLLAELPRVRVAARSVLPVTALILLLLGLATWQRNELWRDPLSFWRQNTELSPGKSRAWEMLGRYLLEVNQLQEGLRALEHAEHVEAARPRGEEMEIYDINMMWALRLLGRYDEALERGRRATARPMRPDLRSTFYLNEGNVYFDRHEWPQAEVAYRAALGMAPHSIPAMVGLASALAQTGQLAEAESLYTVVLGLDPDDRLTRVNLWQVRAQSQLNRAEALRGEGRTPEAIAAYRAALTELESALRETPGDATLRANTERLSQVISELERRSP